MALEKLREFAAAEEVMREVCPAADASDDERLKWHNIMAKLSERRGHTRAARFHYRAAADALPSDPEKAGEVAAVLSNAALLEYDCGDDEKGHEYAERMDDIVEAMPEGRGTLATRIGHARLEAARAARWDDQQAASAVWSRARALIERVSPQDWSRRMDVVCSLALSLQAQGLDRSAIDALREEIEVCPNTFAHQATGAMILLAELLLDADAHEPAAADAAFELLVHAATIEMPRDEVEREAGLLGGLARCAVARDARPAAILLGKMAVTSLARAVTDLATDEARALLARADRMNRRLVDWLNLEGRYSEAGPIRALYEGDRVRRLTFRDARPDDHRSIPVPFRAGEITLVDRWNRHREASVAALALHHSPGDHALPAKVLELAERTPAIVGELLAFEEPRRDERAATSSPRSGRALRLSYAWGETTLSVVAARGRGASLEGPEPIERMLDVHPDLVALTIAELRDLIATPDLWRDAARRLHDWLIAPVREMMDGVARIEVAATGPLAHLPFACLEDDDGFLCELAPVVFVSGGRRRRPGRARAHPKHLLAIGGQDVDGTRDLPTLRAELEAVAASAPAATVVLPDACTRERLATELASAPTHLHFAGHFDIEPGRPDRSFLTLGDGDPLYLSEIASAEFDFEGIELASFSACDTATVDRGREGYESLAQIALDKGVRVVVASLWPIPDAGASAMMRAFYEELFRAASRDPVAALGRVQARLARTARDDLDPPDGPGGIGAAASGVAPVEWAGFAAFTRA